MSSGNKSKKFCILLRRKKHRDVDIIEKRKIAVQYVYYVFVAPDTCWEKAEIGLVREQDDAFNYTLKQPSFCSVFILRCKIGEVLFQILGRGLFLIRNAVETRGILTLES